MIQHKGVSDLVDVLAYWIGGIGSWVVWNWGALFQRIRSCRTVFAAVAKGSPNKRMEADAPQAARGSCASR
jgi:hypothetical protein